jgi:hypothetical protein
MVVSLAGGGAVCDSIDIASVRNSLDECFSLRVIVMMRRSSRLMASLSTFLVALGVILALSALVAGPLLAGPCINGVCT